MRRGDEILTCDDCGRTVKADSKSSRKWRVLLDSKGQYPPNGYRCPECHKARKK